jgi:hypothetical protein
VHNAGFGLTEARSPLLMQATRIGATAPASATSYAPKATTTSPQPEENIR